MDINGTNTGASTYAMKKAIEMPRDILNLVQQIPNTESQSLNSERPVVKQASDPARIAGKGNIIDIIA
ncbi:MAG: hypothetical protein HUN04_16945 [Desulfobacter sp.]|nr:MAG: hypothetical protein HUN04_16945 [Desulfobacter sp.]